MSEKKQQQPDACTLINYTSQGSVATCFRNGEIFYQYFGKKFTAKSAMKECLKSVYIWRSYR